MAYLYEDKLRIAVKYLIEQVEEDCPIEYRTRHLVEAIEEVKELLNEKEANKC